jgi:hypothetical protein
MLLFLMLCAALLTITLMTVETNYRQSIRRDREVEMIHRGVQYERAVRLYYRKYHSYPPSIDRLLNTNGFHFLRKAYKDPMTKDGTWRIARTPGSTNPASGSGSSIFSNQSSTGTSQSTPSAGQSAASSVAPSIPGGAAAGSADNITSAAGESGSSGDQTGPATTSGGSGPVLGGLPMIGVVSKSNAEGIHSFNGKSHYNQWYFIYDPAQDLGVAGLLPNGPYNPKLTLTTAGGTTTPGTPAGTTTNTPAPSPTATNP